MPVTTTRSPGRAAQGHCGVSRAVVQRSSSLTCTYTWNVQDSWGRLQTFICYQNLSCSSWMNNSLTAWHTDRTLNFFVFFLFSLLPPMSQGQPHAHSTKPYALLNFPATSRLGWHLHSNPTTLLLVFKHKLWLKASGCLQLSCFYCKLQWLIKAFTLCYHDLLETGKVGEARVFAMTPRL